VHTATFLAVSYLALRAEGSVREGTFGGRTRAVSDPTLQPDVPFGEVAASMVDYWRRAAGGDLGVFGRADEPVLDVIATALPRSLLLLVLALALAIVLGILIGYLAIDRRRLRPRPLAVAFNVAGFAMPAFYLGILAIQAMIVYGRFAGVRGTVLPATGYGLDSHLVLPVLVLALRPTAEIARLTAELTCEELGKDYVRTAKAKGLSWRLVLLRHAFPNVAAAVVVAIGNSMRYLVSSLVVVEILFDWPGVGELLAHTVAPRIDGRPVPAWALYDPALVAGLVTALAALSVLVGLATGIVARAVDPRLRAGTAS
jgi:peptide/nickel transport system permease protein